MLCGVTATLGSNPSATATAARPHWGRAVLLCLAGVPCGCVAVWPHGCSGRRRPRPLCVPVGGGPPASRPRREPPMLRVGACGAAGVLGAVGPGRPRDRHTRASLGVVDLEARPCPPDPPAPSTPAAPTLLRCGLVRRLEARYWLSIRNFARNSRLAVSTFEFVSLELQRFREVSKNDRDKLRATFIRRLSHRCAWSSAAGPTNPSTPAAMGVLRHAKPSYGVSSACRSLGWRNFPRLVTVRP